MNYIADTYLSVSDKMREAKTLSELEQAFNSQPESIGKMKQVIASAEAKMANAKPNQITLQDEEQLEYNRAKCALSWLQEHYKYYKMIIRNGK